MSKPDDIPQDVWDEIQELRESRLAAKPSDIPADVWKIALAAMDDIVVDDVTLDGEGFVIDIAAAEKIARAILAERERCAKVCDAFIQAYDEEIASLGLEQPRRGSPAKYAVKCIASDIRKGGE